MRRAPKRYVSEVYPIRLEEMLPRIRIPLLEPDADVTLNMQAVPNQCYENGGYARLLDYRNPPETMLGAEEAAWVDDLLHRKGLR